MLRCGHTVCHTVCRCWRPPGQATQGGRGRLIASCSVGWPLYEQGRETALLSAARAARAGSCVVKAGGLVVKAGGLVVKAGGLVVKAGGNQKL